jgi:hypothetical protein
VIAQVQGTSPISGRPVLVLSKPLGAKPGRFDQLWTSEQAVLAARYPGSQHFAAPGGGHFVHKDERDWFVASVREFMAEAGQPHYLLPNWQRPFRD